MAFLLKPSAHVKAVTQTVMNGHEDSHLHWRFTFTFTKVGKAYLNEISIVDEFALLQRLYYNPRNIVHLMIVQVH